MSIFKRIVAIMMIVSLQACGAGTQGLLGGQVTTVGPATSNTIETADQVAQGEANAPTMVLDIVVPSFDPGLGEKKDDDPTWTELRRAEANLFAIELKKALEQTNKFGAVRVTPDRTATAALYVMGRIAVSNGAEVEIDLAVANISGRDLVADNAGFSFGTRKAKLHGVFKTKSFSHDVEEDYFKNYRNKGKNPYLPVFDEAAAYVVELTSKYSTVQANNLNKLTNMRFAASFSEDAFAEHVEIENGLVSLTSLPSEDDEMYQRVQAIRVRDQLFIDELQTDYEQFAAKVAPSYVLWQEQTLAERAAMRQAEKESRKAAIGAVLLFGLALAASADGDSGGFGGAVATTVAVGAGMAGVGLVSDAINSSEEAKMHNELIKELGDSVEIDVAPKVVEFEEKEKQLVGDAKEQFAQWRAFLKTIYELEKTPATTL